MRWATIIEGMAPAEPIADADPERPQEQERDARCERTGHTEADDRDEAGGERRRRPEPRGEAWSGRREHAHAQDRDRGQETRDAGGQPQVVRINGSNGPIARICGRIASEAMNSPATTATGTARALTVTGSDVRRSPGRRDHGSMLGAPPNCSRAYVATRASVARARAALSGPRQQGRQRSVAVGVVVSTRWVGALWTAGMLPSRPAW